MSFRGVKRAGVAVFTAAILAPSAASAATLVVDTPTDGDPATTNDGFCSLREAVQATNLNMDVNGADDCDHDGMAGLDTIQLGAIPYQLVGTINEFSNAGGDLNITPGAGGVVINGVSPSMTTVSSTVMDRVMNIGSGAGGATIQDLTVSGGNEASEGGGISTSGPLTITNSTISNNDAERGGGLATTGMVALNVTNSVLTGNDATSQGGAIDASAGTVNITGGQLDDNTVSTNDNMVASPRGGAIYLSAVTATITNTTISDNDVNSTDATDPKPLMFGGGLYNNGMTTISGTTFSGNFTANGDPFNSEAAAIFNSSSGSLIMRNSTLSGNSAQGEGGALFNNGGDATLNHVTVMGNTSGENATAIEDRSSMVADFVRLRGTLIVNGANACESIQPLDSDGYNIDQGSSCGLTGTGDLQSLANPMLDPMLSNNGGPTATHALLAGSQAIDRIPAVDCDDENGNPLTVDQRGSGRPSPAGGACDVGAFEVFVAPPTQPTPVPAATSTENPECAALRARLKKAKSKKKKRKLRKQLRALGC